VILEIRPIQAEEGFRWALKRLEYFFSEKPVDPESIVIILLKQ